MFKRNANKALEYRYAGDALVEQGKYIEAINSYNRAIRLQPYAVFYNQRGLAEVKLGQYDSAYDDFVRASQLEPSQSLFFQNMAGVLNLRGIDKADNNKPKEAYDDFMQAHKLLPSSAVSAANVAWALHLLGNYQNAIEWGKKAIQLDKTCYLGYSRIALASQYLGLKKESLINFEQAVAFNKTDYWRKAIDLNDKGLLHAALGQEEKALACHFEAIDILALIKDRSEQDLATELATNFCNMGICYQNLYDFDKAEQYFRKALEYKANSVPPKMGVAICLFDKLEYGKAIRLCDDIIKISPELYHAYSRKGWVYLDAKEFQKAYLAFDKAAQLAYNDSIQQALLGFSRLLCKQIGFAQDIFQKLLRNTPRTEADVPEVYIDNEMSNRALNEETSSSTTEAAKKLCQFGLQCINFLNNKVNEVVDEEFKAIFINFRDYYALLVGFIQVYSDELMRTDVNRFIRLCHTTLQIVEKRHEKDRSPRAENLVSRVKEFISIANKRMDEVRIPYTKPEGKINENEMIKGLQKVSVSTTPAGHKPNNNQTAQAPTRSWSKTSSLTVKSHPLPALSVKPTVKLKARASLDSVSATERDSTVKRMDEVRTLRTKPEGGLIGSEIIKGLQKVSVSTPPARHKLNDDQTAEAPTRSRPASSLAVKSQPLSALPVKLTVKPKAQALFDFVSTSKEDLNFKRGETLIILEQTSDWWLAENSKGQRGNVPYNYLELQKSPRTYATNSDQTAQAPTRFWPKPSPLTVKSQLLPTYKANCLVKRNG